MNSIEEERRRWWWSKNKLKEKKKKKIEARLEETKEKLEEYDRLTDWGEEERIEELDLDLDL